jgi:predicted unusual protein kinase regulating ubiquinone biosynthesis (AarF/ABC1/UbiB family)
MKLCVYAGIVDESASRMSFDEFARQFTSELDYDAERRNLHETYQSTLLPGAPYSKRGVVVPHVYDELSTSKVITMAYLRGPKLEEEARRQLAALGIDMSRGIGQIVREAAARDDALDGVEEEAELMMSQRQQQQQQQQQSWKMRWGRRVGQWIGVDRALVALRVVQRVRLWTTALTASAVRLLPMMPTLWRDWSEQQVTSYQQVQRLDMTKKWIDALFDVHGYQIFQQGLFNADCHPGNILVLEDENGQITTQLGLIDYGQCKRLTPTEQAHVAELLLSVANQESDEQVAAAFRRMQVQTKNDSTEFLAEMARLMFGRFETHHLDHAYHRRLHEMDRVTYFPKELSMVYRTSLLLRGLAVSLQINPSVSEQWRIHAQAAVEQHGGALAQEVQRPPTTKCRSLFADDQEPLLVGEVAAAG